MAYGKWIGAWLGWINSQSVLGGAMNAAQDGTGDALIKLFKHENHLRI